MSAKSGRVLTDKETFNITQMLDDLFFNYSPEYVDKTLVPPIIQYMCDIYITKETCAVILGDVCNILKHEKTLGQIYDGTIPPIPAKTILSEKLTDKEYRRLEDTFEPRKREGTIRDRLSNNTWVIINFKTKEIYQEKESNQKDKDPSVTYVLRCVPREVIVYDTVLLDQPRSFKIVWESNLSDRTFTTDGESGGATIKEITEYLVNAGFSPAPKLVEGAISSTINAFISEGLATMQKDIDNPGFYYDLENDKILAVHKDIVEPTRKELVNSVRVLNELAKYFKGNESLLATILKWGLLSGFSYAKKQAGKWMPWLYLKGSAGSGKTTIAKLPLFLWGEPKEGENNIGGSGFDTQARVGAKLSKSCDPLVVNEPAGAFNRQSVVEMIKVCVESTTGRGKMIGGSYKQIPAFSPVIFTANHYLPEDDALLRRLYVISFSYSMRKSEAEKKAFERVFRMDTPHVSPLRELRHLTDFVVNEIMLEPGLLLDDWRECIDTLLIRLFVDIDEQIPEWLLGWEESESLEDFDNNQVEDIRMFFNDCFNQARKKIAVYNENGYASEVNLDNELENGAEDFEDVNWHVVNNRQLDWAMPKVSRNNTRYICFTQGLRKAISQHVDFCSDLKSIGELLGWKYCNTKFGKKQMKVLKVEFNEFLEFMYPSLEFDDDLEGGD